MLIDESDLSAARGAPVQCPITQPKHAGGRVTPSVKANFLNSALRCESRLEGATFLTLAAHVQNFANSKPAFAAREMA